MRRVAGSIALAALALLGGCAGSPQPSGTAVPVRTGVRDPAVIPCSTIGVLIATVARCGGGAFDLGVAAE